MDETTSQQQPETRNARGVLLIARVFSGLMRTFALTPMMFFNVVLVIFYVLVLSSWLRQASVVNSEQYMSLMSVFYNKLTTQFDIMATIRQIITGSFIFSAIYTLVRAVTKVKKFDPKKVLLVSIAAIVLLWLFLFMAIGIFGMKGSFGQAVIVYLMFTGVHLMLCMIYFGSSFLLDQLTEKLLPSE